MVALKPRSLITWPTLKMVACLKELSHHCSPLQCCLTYYHPQCLHLGWLPVWNNWKMYPTIQYNAAWDIIIHNWLHWMFPSTLSLNIIAEMIQFCNGPVAQIKCLLLWIVRRGPTSPWSPWSLRGSSCPSIPPWPLCPWPLIRVWGSSGT